MMLGCKEISSIRTKKCKALLVERQDSRYYLLAYPKHAMADMEFDMLRTLRVKGMRVPKTIQRTDDELLLEYIEGRTLYEEIGSGPVFKLTMLAQGMAKTMAQFGEIVPGKRMGNVDLRGYLVKGSVLYLVDVDQIVTGTYAEQVADAVVSVLTDNLPKDRQLAFAKALYKAAGVDEQAFAEAFCAIADLARAGGKLNQSNEQLLATLK